MNENILKYIIQKKKFNSYKAKVVAFQDMVVLSNEVSEAITIYPRLSPSASHPSQITPTHQLLTIQNFSPIQLKISEILCFLFYGQTDRQDL